MTLITTHTEFRRLSLRPDGMFSNVNEVIEQLRLANNTGYKFQIDWSSSCYRDETRPEDPWSYYFLPCFEFVEQNQGILESIPSGGPVTCTQENIITPRLEDGKMDPLLLPHDRHGAHDIIERYIRPRADVLDLVDQFQASNFRSPVIGLHIRGQGRRDGGVSRMRKRYNSENQVPYQPFFAQTDEALRLLPSAQIFVCSDSGTVIEHVQERYGERVISWNAQRSPFGEMHAHHSENKGLEFSPYQLGLDILVEALLLSRTDIFVHGNSNVANFVLCKSPDLIHAYVQA